MIRVPEPGPQLATGRRVRSDVRSIMTSRRWRLERRFVPFAFLAFSGLACGGGDTTSSSTTSGGTTVTDGAGGSSTTATGPSSSTGFTTSSSSGTGGEGGAPPTVGAPGDETVSAGQMCMSPSYKMVMTLGQPTQNQGLTSSPGFLLRGGLIGATQK